MGADTISIESPIETWTFEFWKDLVESTQDIPGAVGRLAACTHIYGSSEDMERIRLYLLEVADRSESKRSDFRAQKLAEKACELLKTLISRRDQGRTETYCVYLTTRELDKLLWFFRPREDLSEFVNPCFGQEEEYAYLRRLRGSLAWELWQGAVLEARPEHKLKALDIFFVSGKLWSLVPAGKEYSGASWRMFEDASEHLEKLARIDMQRLRASSIEKAGWRGSAPALALLLLRSMSTVSE